MPGRPPYSEEKPAATGARLAADALRALGHGCLLAGGGMGIGAMLGLTTAMGMGSVATAMVLGMGCWLSADAIGDATIAADAQRKREAEAELAHEDAAILALERNVLALDVARDEAESQEPSQHFVALIESQREHEAAGKSR